MSELIKLNMIDNVATARRHLDVGEEGASSVIPKGHKMALKDIAQGDPIIKYAQVIGYAAEPISSGSHVHVKNLEFRSVDQDYEFGTNLSNCEKDIATSTFLGYRRSNGRVGTRNTIAILTSVNCSATAARLIAEELQVLGIDVNCAPILDLLERDASNIIGDRSFSKNKNTVSKMGDLCIKFFHQNSIGTVIKHIPCLLYTSPSPRDKRQSRMPSSA